MNPRKKPCPGRPQRLPHKSNGGCINIIYGNLFTIYTKNSGREAEGVRGNSGERSSKKFDACVLVKTILTNATTNNRTVIIPTQTIDTDLTTVVVLALDDVQPGLVCQTDLLQMQKLSYFRVLCI